MEEIGNQIDEQAPTGAAVRTKKKKSLKVAILQTFVTLTIISVGSISTNFYLRSRNAVLELSDDVIREVTDKIILTSTHYLEVPANQTRTFSKLVTDVNIMNIHEKMWEYMWEQLLIMPQVQAYFLADSNGNYVQVRREPELAPRYIDGRRNSLSKGGSTGTRPIRSREPWNRYRHSIPVFAPGTSTQERIRKFTGRAKNMWSTSSYKVLLHNLWFAVNTATPSDPPLVAHLRQRNTDEKLF